MNNIDDLFPDDPPRCWNCKHHVGVFMSFCAVADRCWAIPIENQGRNTPPEWCPGWMSAISDDTED